jgi:translocation and assembly module TamB
MATTKKSARRILFGLALLFALGALGALALPLWLPWVLGPGAAKAGVRYSSYEREGYGRFVLHAVQYRGHGVEFRAGRVEGLLPFGWLWERYAAPDRTTFVLVEAWSLRLTSETQQASARSSPTDRKTNSVVTVLREARTNLFLVESWVPRAELRRGIVQLPSGQLELPALHWMAGQLTGEIVAPALGQRASFQAKLPVNASWQLSTSVRPLQAEVDLTFQSEADRVEMQGAILWRTNRMAVTAEFPEQGWPPRVASVTADKFRIPASLLGLGGYQDLSGSLAARWTNGQFRIDLNAQAQPVPTAQGALSPVTAALRASGDTNLVRVEEATLRAPWLRAELSQGAAFDFKGHMLSAEVLFRLQAELSQQPWIKARGALTGGALIRRSTREFPDVAVELSGKGLESVGLRADTLDVKGSLSWPWMEISRAEVHFAEGASAALIGKGNLQDRFLTNGVLHLEGKLGAKLLPAGIDYQRVLVHADFRGPINRLSHSGLLEVDGLLVPSSTNLNVRAQWRGKQTDLEHFTASVSAGKTLLSMGGSAQAEQGQAGLRFEELSLTQANELLYTLDRPFSVSLDRDQLRSKAASRQWLLVLQPVHWQGPQRSLALEADIAWPSHGTFRGAVERFDTALFAGLFRTAPPSFRLDQLNLAGQWSNGPVQFQMEARGELPVKDQKALAAQVRAHGDAQGLVVEQFQVTSGPVSVISGQGSFPLRVDPTNSSRVLVIDDRQPVEVHALTAPNQVFWDEIAAWTRVGLADPRVQLDVSGPLRAPTGKLTATVAAIRPQGLWTNRELPRMENLRAQLDLTSAAVRLETLQLLLEGQPVALSGYVPLGTDYSTDWRQFFQWQQATGLVRVADAQIGPFARFFPKTLSPQGNLDVNLAIRTNLQFEGQVFVRGAATRPLASLGAVDNLESRLQIAGRRVEIHTFTGTLGGEPFGVTGTVDLGQRNLDTGLPRLALKIRGQSIPLARQPDLILRSDLDLAISNQTNQPAGISGSVRLRDSVFLSDLRVLIPGKVAQPLQRPPFFSIDLEPLADWTLDLRVRGEKFLKVRSPFFRGEVSSDLKLEGTLREPMMIGEVTINSGGVQFPFANLDVTQGLVSFTSADPYRPRLFVTAGARTLGYDVKMEVSGPADAPVIQFTSTPPLSSEQVLLMVTTGELPQQGSSVSAQQRASRLALFLGRNLLSEFGSGQGGADRLTIRSGEDISDQGKQTYSLEYRLSKDWSIVGEYDRFGAFNAELKWRVYSR